MAGLAGCRRRSFRGTAPRDAGPDLVPASRHGTLDVTSLPDRATSRGATALCTTGPGDLTSIGAGGFGCKGFAAR